MPFPAWKTLKPSTKRRILGLGVGGVVASGIAAYYFYSQNCCESDSTSNKKRAASGSCCSSSKPSQPVAAVSCCSGSGITANEAEAGGSNTNDGRDMKKLVYERYSETVRTFDSSQQQESADLLAMQFGYSKEDLEECGNSGSNMGLSCGNPVAMASIRENETIVDLGCGGGFDCFIASGKVGQNGKVIGIDMSHDMIKKAKQNASKNKKNNCQFYLSEIEKMPLQDNSVDCVISNCVLNLVPNKLNAFKEVYRIVRADGGRLAISDIALKKALPSDLNDNMMAYVAGYINCISGAILATEYESKLRQAGFKQIKFVLKNVDLNVWKQSWTRRITGNNSSASAGAACCGVGGGCGPAGAGTEKETETETETETTAGGGGCCAPPTATTPVPKTGINFTQEQREEIAQFLQKVDLNEYIGSYYIFAVK